MLWLRRLLGERGGGPPRGQRPAERDRLEVVQRLLDAALVTANADVRATTADILDRMIAQIKAAFGAEHACIHFVHEAALERSTTMHAMQFCPVGSGPEAMRPTLMASEAALMQRALAHGRPLKLGSVGEESTDAAAKVRELGTYANVRDGLVVPVAYQGDVFAWINVYVPDERAFDGLDQGLLRTVGGVLYGAIKKEAYVRAIERIRATLETHFSPRVVDKLVGSPESLASQPSERLEVSVLFSDIRGFTALSERIEPGVVAELVSEHVDAMAEIVFAYDGIVDKYIGDSVMAVFGSPFPQDDHAQRAVAAALAMVERQRALQSKWADRVAGPLAIGVGVNTGIAIAGTVGMTRREFTHLGDAVNLASRLKDAAEPWQVLIGKSTYDRTHATITASALPPLAIKGKQERVLAYAVTSTVNDTAGGVDGVQSTVTR